MVHGHVLDEAGRPLPLAHVGLDGKLRQAVAADGSFRVSWSPSPARVTKLVFSGANHRATAILVAPEDHELDVTVRLGSPAPAGEVTPSVVLYSVADPKPQAMTKEADGTFSANVEGPDGRYAYRIDGVLDEGLSGEPADGYELVPPGYSYRPQIVIKGGSARITFDPRKLHASFSAIAFDHPTSTSAALTAIDLRVAQAEEGRAMTFDAVVHAKGGPPGDAGERIHAADRAEWTALRQALAARASNATPAIVRQYAALAYFRGSPIETASAQERSLANRILGEVPPDDPMWAWGSIDNVLRVADPTPPHHAYAKAFIAKQPATEAVSALLFAQLQRATDEAEIRALFDELSKPRYAETIELEEALAYRPDRPLAPGRAIELDVKALASADRVTAKDFAGTVYLIDVWGTWCVGCVAEMPRLHELYAKYGGAPTEGRRKRFEILSLAAENDAEKVARFRADRAHPMPWKHGIVDPDTFLDKFGGPGLAYPTYVLVDETGKVIRSSPHLNPRDLPELLERVLR